MNGWSSHLGADRWDDEPAWIYAITWEWEPVSGRRHPGEPGRRRRAVHVPVYEVRRGEPMPPPSWAGPEERRPVRYAHTPVRDRPVDDSEFDPADGERPTDDLHGRIIPSPSGFPPGRVPAVPGYSSPAPAWRAEPSWNQPVPLPELLPGGRQQPPTDPQWADPDRRWATDSEQTDPGVGMTAIGPHTQAPDQRPGPDPRWGPPDQRRLVPDPRPGVPDRRDGGGDGPRYRTGWDESTRPLASPPPVVMPQNAQFRAAPPVPQDVRPQFRDPPPPVQSMPPPFYGRPAARPASDSGNPAGARPYIPPVRPRQSTGRADWAIEPVTAPPATSPRFDDHEAATPAERFAAADDTDDTAELSVPGEPAAAPPVSGAPVSPSTWFQAVPPPGPGADSVATESAGTDVHGLGWLLRMSGLGAVTVTEAGPAADEPGPAPVAPAAPEADGAAHPAVNGMPAESPDWFDQVTETRLTIPGPIADEQPPASEEASPTTPGEPVQHPGAAGQGEPAGEVSGTPPDLQAVPADDPVGPGGPGVTAETEPERAARSEPETDAERRTGARRESAAEAEAAVGPVTAAAVEPEAVVPAGPEATAARAVVLDAVWDGSARRPRYGREDPLRRLADPEQVLSAYPWWFSGQTLRERADGPDQLRSLRDRLTDKLEYAERDAVRARLLSVRAVVSRVLGDLDIALADGRAALEHAEATGELRPVSIVQARLAHVLQWRGEYAEADRLYAQADSVELPGRLRAEITELAGRSAYEQGRFLEAVNHFEAALDLRRNGDPELVARIEQALDAVSARARDKGWGPYPRTTDEILQRPTPQPPDGNAFAEIQPFGEYAAWVRRPDSAVWELVDGRGELLIDGAAGYRAARPFSDGLAWVSRDEAGGWFAIDHQNQVVVPGGFDDVGPFRRGVAPIRRGDGWGAIDRYGLIVIQPEYRGFATVLVGGRRPEGFTDEGLAIVDAGDGLGVVDRTGRLLVAPVHARLVIHPVAYLIGDRSGRWGALDRHGDPLVDVVHAAEEDVADEVERLFGDARPVL